MSILWVVSENKDTGTKTLIITTKTGSVLGALSNTNEHYDEVMEYLNGGGNDAQHITSIINPTAKTLDTRLKVTLAQIDRFKVHGGHVMIDGQKAPQFISDFLVRKLNNADTSYQPVLALYDKYKKLDSPLQDKIAEAMYRSALDTQGRLVVSEGGIGYVIDLDELTIHQQGDRLSKSVVFFAEPRQDNVEPYGTVDFSEGGNSMRFTCFRITDKIEQGSITEITDLNIVDDTNESF